MNAKKCDRCGKFYENYPIGNQAGVYNAVCRLRVSGSGAILADSKHIDLCESCMDEFLNWSKLKDAE